MSALFVGGAYVPTPFVRMYAPLGWLARGGVAQRCALLALLCGSWCAGHVSCLNVINMVDVPMLRTAEEAAQRYLRATPLR